MAEEKGPETTPNNTAAAQMPSPNGNAGYNEAMIRVLDDVGRAARRRGFGRQLRQRVDGDRGLARRGRPPHGVQPWDQGVEPEGGRQEQQERHEGELQAGPDALPRRQLRARDAAEPLARA